GEGVDLLLHRAGVVDGDEDVDVLAALVDGRVVAVGDGADVELDAAAAAVRAGGRLDRVGRIDGGDAGADGDAPSGRRARGAVAGIGRTTAAQRQHGGANTRFVSHANLHGRWARLYAIMWTEATARILAQSPVGSPDGT